MLELDWIRNSYGEGKLEASLQQSRELLCKETIDDINKKTQTPRDKSLSIDIQNSIEVLELNLIDILVNQNMEDTDSQLKKNASNLFELYRSLLLPESQTLKIKQMLLTTCFGIMGEKNADVKRYLQDNTFPESLESENWATNVFINSGIAFLLNVRKSGWSDLIKASDLIINLRKYQKKFENSYIKEQASNSQEAAFELIALYHFAKIMDILSMFFRNGERPRKILQDIDFHFDNIIDASNQINLAEFAILSMWVKEAVHRMVKNSVWWVVDSTNPNMTQFVKNLSSKESKKPIFELWPSQSQALVKDGLLDPAKRAVVVQMPTSGGKTLLAEFRILQTKQLYPDAWVAFIVPTRALVNQISNRLREDLSQLGIKVERAVPAFELDPMEEELLLGNDSFDVLVTTQEKLDLLIRSGKLVSEKRPLGLVILDEAHNIKNGDRGLRTELLLATINREFNDVQFLLLSPFVPNMEELANWLGSERSAKISVNWRPNDQLVALAYPKGRGKNWSLMLKPLATSQPTISFNKELELSNKKTREKTVSQLNKRDISSLVGSILSKRSGVIVLALGKDDVSAIAEQLYSAIPEQNSLPKEVEWVQKYIEAECGTDYLLNKLIKKGIAFHHAGVPMEVRYLLEWLMSHGFLKVMVATTTLAQGVNFPISAIVINDYKIGVPPEDMSADEFWNIAGRAGRSDQETLGIIAFTSKSDENPKIEKFVQKNITELTSHLEKIVNDVIKSGSRLDLDYLVRNNPGWSNFVQYLCHAYRQTENHSKFLAETQTLMKATYGYQRIMKNDVKVAREIVKATEEYAATIKKIDKQVLYMVDQTGFSPGTIMEMRKDFKEIGVNISNLSASGLFSTKNNYLRDIIGTLIKAPELDFETEHGKFKGTDIADIISKWVNGDSIASIAQHEAFARYGQNKTSAVTSCTKIITNYSNNAAWGMGAFESLGIKKEDMEKLDQRESMEIKSIPAMIYFGVNTLEGVVLRNLGVPRSIAISLGEKYKEESMNEHPSLIKVKSWLEQLDINEWNSCAPKNGQLSGYEYQTLWKIMNGYYRSPN